jgi:hypothetical protein
MIRAYFGGVGCIRKQGKDSIQYCVGTLKDLSVVIDHFEKYPLITQKRADFELFKGVVDLMNRQEHLRLDSLKKIVSLRAAMNNGLSEKQKAAFPGVVSVQRPIVVDQVIKDPHWLSGFVTGEGCFLIVIEKSSSHKAGYRVKLKFQITQHSRDEALLKSLVDYLNCGNYRPRADRDAGDLIVTRLSDITETIIPFFEKSPIQGVKSLDFADYKRASDIMKFQGHLTQEGLEQIRKIKAGMNSGRISLAPTFF